MKISIETDLNIMKDGEPDIQKIMIDQNVGDLNDVLDMFDQALKAMGYCYKGRLEIVDEEEF
jgi:hypothetical protein